MFCFDFLLSYLFLFLFLFFFFFSLTLVCFCFFFSLTPGPDWADDIERDLREELQQHGVLTHFHMDRTADSKVSQSPGQSLVWLTFFAVSVLGGCELSYVYMFGFLIEVCRVLGGCECTCVIVCVHVRFSH